MELVGDDVDRIGEGGKPDLQFCHSASKTTAYSILFWDWFENVFQDISKFVIYLQAKSIMYNASVFVAKYLLRARDYIAK